MKALIAQLANGESCVLFIVGTGFNTQKWADSRHKALKLLHIVKINEIPLGI